jgi:hypothetical protein
MDCPQRIQLGHRLREAYFFMKVNKCFDKCPILVHYFKSTIERKKGMP